MLKICDDDIITAERNVENVPCILKRKKNSNNRANIRNADKFSY